MEARTVSKGLAWFSLGLGIAELVAGRQMGKALGAENRTGVIRTFGAREIMAGLGILQAPAHSPRVWNRVAGDALDLAALGGLLRGGNSNARWYGVRSAPWPVSRWRISSQRARSIKFPIAAKVK